MKEPDDGVSLGIDFCVALLDDLVPREDEKGAEEINDPVKGLE